MSNRMSSMTSMSAGAVSGKGVVSDLDTSVLVSCCMLSAMVSSDVISPSTVPLHDASITDRLVTASIILMVFLTFIHHFLHESVSGYPGHKQIAFSGTL
jgi:hypothetical protein